ncbi:monovalent cation/H+ antiporter complex subunit F [Kitasatospora sp. NPDC059571]|uniref:monovalent cation/H+ antiporter complex subunit F n=1 Tax=Kitasatospora sp. NPDC059571 TaxID=3346871 RepID=UPI0036CA2463
MSTWTATALALLAIDGAAGLQAVCRGSAVRRLVGASLLSAAAGALLLLLPQVHDRPFYQDLALALAVLAPAGALVLACLAGRRRDENADRHGNRPENGPTAGTSGVGRLPASRVTGHRRTRPGEDR